MQLGHFEGVGEPVEWKVYGHDQPLDLWKRLARAGFEPDAPETLVVLDLHRPLPAAPLPRDAIVERITTETGLEDFVSVGYQAFGTDPSQPMQEFLPRLPHGTVSCYVAYVDGEPACAGRLETPSDHEFAGLYGGCTSRAHRRRGLYRALVVARAREAAERGYRFLTVDAQDGTSLPILKRLGFVPLTSVVAWIWRPRATVGTSMPAATRR
jgi:ribosomal protein S18 acetylase RimI-like enzyme